jgi:hypothetical protein
MQVIFEFPDPEGAELRTLAESRVRFALRRLSWLAPRARVHLSDVNGPRGGVDKRCQVELLTDSTDPVVITSMARDRRAALHGALSRAARALLRSWQHKRGPAHLPRSVLALDS